MMSKLLTHQHFTIDGKQEGGEGGIRTPGGCYTTPVFKTGAFGHSATSPRLVFRVFRVMKCTGPPVTLHPVYTRFTPR